MAANLLIEPFDCSVVLRRPSGGDESPHGNSKLLAAEVGQSLPVGHGIPKNVGPGGLAGEEWGIGEWRWVLK